MLNDYLLKQYITDSPPRKKKTNKKLKNHPTKTPKKQNKSKAKNQKVATTQKLSNRKRPIIYLKME